jgi:mRNA interferase MazF
VVTRAAAKASARSGWVPERQHIIWIDCNPQAGGEMRDLHPMLVLSPAAFNERTGIVIGLPMTTAAYNASNPFAVAVGKASGRKAGQTSYVLCHQPKSFDWKARGAKPHVLGRLTDAAFVQACGVLEQIVGLSQAT